MLAAQRRQRILDEVRRVGGVRVSELTTLLGVSDMTVRRDLDRLSQEGLVSKVHGGATTPQSASVEPGFEVKSRRQLAEKHALAEAAAMLVQPGQAVALGAGTTTWLLAQHLQAVEGLTVVTNSVKVADVLRPCCDVVLTGGVRTPSDALVGPVADLVLRSLHFDVAFLGCHGMSAAGLSTPNLAEAATNRAFVRAAARVVVVADSTKWGTAGLMTWAELSEVDVLITDRGLDLDAQRLLQSQVGRLHVVQPQAQRVAR
ncbi:MAG: Transcriptional regulator, DeoR family [uncultured Frankineae bacterium]|uniref:Transcriptional regulator, DeoR family n=1 Tax=uncultured Frankineae bacterium TaxID=437475 RepID=A0A6J4KZL6_9ACTN|nr:MAG: Transcriptional regulator, DeoR family [uncultured Frankineae bacterium]